MKQKIGLRKQSPKSYANCNWRISIPSAHAPSKILNRLSKTMHHAASLRKKEILSPSRSPFCINFYPCKQPIWAQVLVSSKLQPPNSNADLCEHYCNVSAWLFFHLHVKTLLEKSNYRRASTIVYVFLSAIRLPREFFVNSFRIKQ